MVQSIIQRYMDMKSGVIVQLVDIKNSLIQKYSQHNPSLREVILEKKLLPFGHCPKRGGSNLNQKVWGSFFGLSFGHFQ